MFSWKPESGYGFIDIANAAAQVLLACPRSDLSSCSSHRRNAL